VWEKERERERERERGRERGRMLLPNLVPQDRLLTDKWVKWHGGA
jgi:hypothetical protein